jgi:hypothetical protein
MTQPTTEATEVATDNVEAAVDGPEVDADGPETFDRDYVSKLRQESAKHRTRAKQADDYAQRLHAQLVKADGRLADPTDLTFDEEHLTDPEKLTAAIDSLLEAKPHFKTRKPAAGTDIGQGNRGTPAEPAPSLLGAIRGAMGMA